MEKNENDFSDRKGGLEQRGADAIGFVLVALVVAMQWMRRDPAPA